MAQLMDDSRRRRFAAWMEANGVDTSRVPESTYIEITDGQIFFDEVLYGEDGRVKFVNGEFAWRRVSVQMKEPMPADL